MLAMGAIKFYSFINNNNNNNSNNNNNDNNDNFINQFLKNHFNMSKKCSIYLKSSVLLQNIIIIIIIIF